MLHIMHLKRQICKEMVLEGILLQMVGTILLLSYPSSSPTQVRHLRLLTILKPISN